MTAAVGLSREGRPRGRRPTRVPLSHLRLRRTQHFGCAPPKPKALFFPSPSWVSPKNRTACLVFLTMEPTLPTKPDVGAHTEAVTALKAKIQSFQEVLAKSSKAFDHERKVLMGFKAKFDEEQDKFVLLR
jgi:hypothetical protein